MEKYEKSIVSICEMFISGKYDIEEFQSRLEGIALPDKLDKAIYDENIKAIDELELIRFTCLQNEYETEAAEIAKQLINFIVK